MGIETSGSICGSICFEDNCEYRVFRRQDSPAGPALFEVDTTLANIDTKGQKMFHTTILYVAQGVEILVRQLFGHWNFTKGLVGKRFKDLLTMATGKA